MKFNNFCLLYLVTLYIQSCVAVGNLREKVKRLKIWTSRKDEIDNAMPPVTPIRKSHAKTPSQQLDKKELALLQHHDDGDVKHKSYCITCRNVVDQTHVCCRAD